MHWCRRIVRNAVLVVWLAAVLAIMLRGSTPQAQRVQPAPDFHLPKHVQLERGDWVWRAGTGADSRFIQRLGRHHGYGRFSHIGMVVATTPEILIAHATTDDDPTRPNQVLLTPIGRFLSAQYAQTLAIGRPSFLSPAQRAATADYARTQAGRPFVLDGRDSPHFYCTTLILEAVRQSDPLFSPTWQYLDMAVFRGEYLFPDALTREQVQWIYSASYNQEGQLQSTAF